MDFESAALVICITIFAVIGINAAIYVMVSRGGTVGQIELMRRAANRLRQPWEPEDNALQELSEQVAELKRWRENKDLPEE
jgi:hypothetical protein